MARQKSELNVITANRLRDGVVVFWSDAGKWSEEIHQAEIAQDGEWIAYLTKVGEVAEARNIIVDPYLVAVRRNENAIEPLHIREKFRTLGPSVRTDLGKQANPESKIAAKPEARPEAEIAATQRSTETTLIAAE